MNPIKPMFQRSQVLKAVPGLDPDIFDDLVSRKLIEPESGRTPGQGKKNLYSVENIVQIALVQALMDLCIAPSVAVEMCDRLLMIHNFRGTGKFPFHTLVRACIGRDRDGVRQIWTRRPGAPDEPEVYQLIESAEKNGHAALVLPTRVIEERTVAALQEMLDGGAA